MNTKTVLFALLSLLVLAPAAALAGPQVGDPAPDFSLPDTAWVMQQFSQYRGQVVLLNFWTSS